LEGKFQEASIELAKQNSTDPNVVVANGRSLAGLGEFKKAADEFRKAADFYTAMATDAQKTKIQVTEMEDLPIVVDESPLPKPKFDWYQSPTHVFVSIAVKKVQSGELNVSVSSKQVDVAVFNKYRLTLAPFASLDPSMSTHSVTEYKIELKLSKLVPGNWPQLEVAGIAAPAQIASTLPKPYSSGKSSKDWSKIEKEATDAKEDEESGDPLNTLFKKIYKDADEDTRRAMMKSYQTSGGTVLTTNWKEAAGKDFAKEIKPPKGQIYKTWDGEVISKDDEDDK